MKQVFVARNDTFQLNPAATTYDCPICLFDLTRTVENLANAPWAVDGTFKNLIVKVSTAPGVGKSWQFTVRKNGVDTTVTCTISGTNVTARDTTHSFSISPGDLLTVKCVPSSTPAAPGDSRMSIEFDSTNAGESGYSLNGTFIGGGETAEFFNGVFAFRNTWTKVSANRVKNVVAAAGSIKALYARKDGSATGTFDFYLYKNGVKQDGSGGTVNTHVQVVVTSGAAQSSAAFTLPVSPGDDVHSSCQTASGGAVGSESQIGIRFLATNDGESQFCGLADDLGSNSADRYAAARNSRSTNWTTGEAAADCMGGVTTMSLSGLRVLLTTGSPGTSKSLTYKLRKNAANGGPSVTISDAATSGTDSTNTASIADGDTVDILQTPAGSPTMQYVTWGMVQVVGPIVITVAASSITSVGATLNGTITPNGPPSVTGFFLWDTANPPVANTTSPSTSIGSGSSPVNYSFVLTGLIPNTTYYFRAVGNDGTADIDGAILSFTTIALPSYQSPCSLVSPLWWGVIKGHVLDDLSFTTYKASQLMQRDAATRFGGPKPPRLLSFTGMKRVASEWRTGAWPAQGGSVKWADTDRVIRGDMETDQTGSMVSCEYWHFLDSAEWRAGGYNPWLIFQGKLVRDRLIGDLTWEGDLRDQIGSGYSLNRIEAQVPNRPAWLDFGAFGYSNAGKLGVQEIKVPIIAGTHSDEATTQLGRVKLIYMGTMICNDAVTRHVGLLCGHACDGGVINAYAMKGGPPPVNQVVWGTNAWAPGQTGWGAVNPSSAALYTDLTSIFDSVPRRYTILFFDDSGGKTLGTDFSKGDQEIWVNTHGFTVSPDGTGGEITDLHAQILHCLQNFFGWGTDQNGNPINVWTAGAWLPTPFFEFYPGSGTLIPHIVDTSFTDVANISTTYTSDNRKFKGAFIVGNGGVGETFRDFMARAAVSGYFQWGWNNRYSQLFISMLDRRRTNFTAGASSITDRINTLISAPLRVELQDELLVEGFNAGWDFNFRTNEFNVIDVQDFASATGAARFGIRPGEPEGYTCISDTVTAMAVGTQRFQFRSAVRFLVKWKETICGLRQDILSAVKMSHFAGRSSSGYSVRVLYIQSYTINQDQTVDIEAFDVDALLS